MVVKSYWVKWENIINRSPQTLPIWCQRVIYHANRVQYNISTALEGKKTINSEKVARVPFVITIEMKQKLQDLGYSPETIRTLSPVQALDIVKKSSSDEILKRPTNGEDK